MPVLVGKTGAYGSGVGFFTRAAIVLLLCLVATAFVLGTPLVARMLFDFLQTDAALSQTEANALAGGPPAAIVILSAGRRGEAPEFAGALDNETLDALSLERVRYGAYLARKTGLPILVSGGLGGSRHPSLAGLMADVLSADYGIPAKWLESRSSNTAENAIYSSEILKRAGIARVILVTHAWHMKRAKTAFAANGLSIVPAPTAYYRPRWSGFLFGITPGLGSLRMSGEAIHEIVGSVWYRLQYGY